MSKKQLAEFIGIASVVASLIFVGIQLLLDRRIAESEVYSQRSESLKADYRSQLESEAYLDARVTLWEEGDRPFFWTAELESYMTERELSPRQTIALIISVQTVSIHYDTVYFQYNQGLLDESSWLGFRASLENRLGANPLERAVIRSFPRGLSDVLDDILGGEI